MPDAKLKTRKLPRWMRRQVACPDCGYILQRERGEAPNGLKWKQLRRPIWHEGLFTTCIPNGFTCPRCKAHYTEADFWEEQREKWDRTYKEEA